MRELGVLLAVREDKVSIEAGQVMFLRHTIELKR